MLSERDVSVYESGHQLMGYPLHEFNIKVVNSSFESDRYNSLDADSNTLNVNNNLFDTKYGNFHPRQHRLSLRKNKLRPLLIFKNRFLKIGRSCEFQPQIPEASDVP